MNKDEIRQKIDDAISCSMQDLYISGDSLWFFVYPDWVDPLCCASLIELADSIGYEYPTVHYSHDDGLTVAMTKKM